MEGTGRLLEAFPARVTCRERVAVADDLSHPTSSFARNPPLQANSTARESHLGYSVDFACGIAHISYEHGRHGRHGV
jgi:hypothetical protein